MSDSRRKKKKEKKKSIVDLRLKEQKINKKKWRCKQFECFTHNVES